MADYKEEYVNINGILQYFLHYKKKDGAPVLLFLHGGPGFFEHLMAYKLDEAWGDCVTQVHWDQRGAGRTWAKNKAVPKNMEQMFSDLEAVVLYLKEKYQVDKIILLGHSWGSILGSVFAMKHPEHVRAYIGSGQVVQMAENEKKEQLLREETARLRGRLDTLGDPLVWKSRLHALEAEHDRVESELEALTVALDELALADEEMRSEFSPALARSAAAALSRLTGGAYTELTLDRELNALVRCAGEPVLHESAFLSRGTADQLYLALRLALCDMLLGGEEPCPIVLDDALINFDDVRMGYALDYLAELAQHRQILLFSCHSREKRYIQTKKEG